MDAKSRGIVEQESVDFYNSLLGGFSSSVDMVLQFIQGYDLIKILVILYGNT